MDYQQAINYLYEQLPMFQRKGAAAYKNNLNNALALDDIYGSPHGQYKTIHVAGTNGKGSVSHTLAAVFQAAGYKTGLYTSPHLKDFRERIRVNGEMISENAVAEFTAHFQHANEKNRLEPSFFELTMAMAFQYFADQKVDVAIIEVGLGGRLDSTNIITPLVSVITNISLDHTQFLGNTLAEIAAEKAGIIKNEVPVVIGQRLTETEGVFIEMAKKKNANIHFSEEEYFILQNNDDSCTISNECSVVVSAVQLDLKGNYQFQNIATAMATLSLLKGKGFCISVENIKEGLENVTRFTGLQGRWQTLSENPKIICDTGHNEAGIALVVQQLKAIKAEQVHIVFGTVNDKNIEHILSLLPKHAHYYFVQANIPRALDAVVLKKSAFAFDLRGEVYPSVQAGLIAAQNSATANDVIFVGGSTFVVAEVL